METRCVMFFTGCNKKEWTPSIHETIFERFHRRFLKILTEQVKSKVVWCEVGVQRDYQNYKNAGKTDKKGYYISIYQGIHSFCCTLQSCFFHCYQLRALFDKYLMVSQKNIIILKSQKNSLKVIVLAADTLIKGHQQGRE